MSFLFFSKLPSELRDEILRNCSTSDQLAFARTCKNAHEQIVPILYHHVDISLHNDEGLFPGRYLNLVLADNPHRIDSERQGKCDERQQLFFDSMKVHPEYGRYVFHLTWTLVSRWDPDGEELHIKEAPMWETFKLLQNLCGLDLGSLAYFPEHTVPTSMSFPEVAHLRLSGQMSSALVRTFLDALDPPRLVSLEFDNLQDFGQDQNGQELDMTTDLSNLLESQDSSGNGVRHPGVMRGHLHRMEGKCSNLRHLSLRSVGQDEERDHRWSPTLDIARYQEWASFIHSVRQTLETLVIEQGLEIENENRSFCRGSPLQIGKPMDDRFVKYLLPTLCEGNWPRLKQLKVFGIGCKARCEVRGYRPGSATAIYVGNVLEGCVASCDVEVEVREEARKTFFFRRQGPGYDA